MTGPSKCQAGTKYTFIVAEPWRILQTQKSKFSDISCNLPDVGNIIGKREHVISHVWSATLTSAALRHSYAAIFSRLSSLPSRLYTHGSYE